MTEKNSWRYRSNLYRERLYAWVKDSPFYVERPFPIWLYLFGAAIVGVIAGFVLFIIR